AVALHPEDEFVERTRGSELVGLQYEGPFDFLPAQEGVVHRVIPWEDVALDEGTGIVHIAPGAGAEDFELSRIHDLPVLAPIDDWLRNMGDWNISRKRYFGLPLPFYPCGCGHVNVIGSRAELEERATAGLDRLQELHRPWIDDVTIRCEACGRDDVRRIAEVGDAWLDAGIV